MVESLATTTAPALYDFSIVGQARVWNIVVRMYLQEPHGLTPYRPPRYVKSFTNVNDARVYIGYVIPGAKHLTAEQTANNRPELHQQHRAELIAVYDEALRQEAKDER